jgi:hypothetical protein
MKILKKYIVFFLLLALIGCDKPLPTELVVDAPDENLEIEVITDDPNFESSIGGVDTTGVTVDLTRFTNVIALSGIKITSNGHTSYLSHAQGIFFDRSEPVIDIRGNRIGYQTRTPGNLFFNDFLSQKHPYIIRYKENGIIKDTLLGFQYLLRGSRGGGHFEFPFGSNINVRFEPLLGSNVNFNVPTPPEINASARIEGRRFNRNLAVNLEWNKFLNPASNFEIIISASRRMGNLTIPLYRIRTPDDGRLIIPGKLLNEIPVDQFHRLTFTLVRKYEGSHDSGENELFLLSQSIHSIRIEFN